MFKEFCKYKDLLFMLTFRDIRIRYKQSVMGFLWAVFMPVIAVCAGIMIKKAISVVSGNPLKLDDVVTISVKVLPWTFFISAIRFSVQSLVGNMNLVTKIYFPRVVIPIATILACLFDLGIAMVTLTLILTFMKIGISIHLFWLPFLLFFLVIFTSGLGLFLATANLFFRDVRYIVQVILMFGIFFTPVYFDAAMFGQLELLMLLNPVGSILESINTSVVLHQMPDPRLLTYTAVVSSLTFLIGVITFKKCEPAFAESI